MQLRCAGGEACTYFVWNDVACTSEVSNINCFGMTTYSPECFKLRCMNVNWRYWRLSQMALETAALCISRPQFQDLSQRKRITSRQKWFSYDETSEISFRWTNGLGSTYWFDNISHTLYQLPVPDDLFHPFLAFIFGVFMSFPRSHISPSWNLEDRTTTTSGRTRFKAWHCCGKTGRSWRFGNVRNIQCEDVYLILSQIFYYFLGCMLRWGNKNGWYVLVRCKIWVKKGKKIDSPFRSTLQGTNISPLKVAGKMSFLFHWWDVLVPWKV